MFKRWWLWITRPVRRLLAYWKQTVFELRIVVLALLVAATVYNLVEGELAIAGAWCFLCGILIAGEVR